jgi:hypothetical protein
MLNDLFGGRVGYLPRMHLVAARVGDGPNTIVAERWHYRGDWLHKAYDTRQVFRADYPHGAHSVLHPSRFVQAQQASTWLQRLQAVLAPKPKPALRPKRPEVAQLVSLPPDEAWRRAREMTIA